MANNSLYHLLIEKKNTNICKDNIDATSLKNNEKYEINLSPEYIQGYYGYNNNLLKYAYKKIIYSYNNLIIIYDLINQNQSIFSEHKNNVSFIRCKEKCRTILSAEESKNKIKIYLWNKSNLHVLTHIKIKKKHFLDIDFLNNRNILLLCKYYEKLIFFVFSIIYKKKKIQLKKEYVNIIKKLDDFCIIKKRKDTKIIKNNKSDYAFANLNKLIIKEIQRKYNACNKCKKRGAKNIENKKHPNVSEIKDKNKNNLYRKTYFKKVKRRAVSGIKFKKYKKNDIFFYYVTFIKPFKKCKKVCNELLRNFKIFVDINKTVCIYNREYVFVYLLKNYILYEKVAYKNFHCYCYSDKGTLFSLIKRNHNFFSIFDLSLFIKNMILNNHFCFKKGKLLLFKNYFEDIFLKSTHEKDNGKENEEELREKYGNIRNDLNIESISSSLSHNDASNYINGCFNNLINDEISVIEIITFIYTREDNDMDVIFNLQKCIEKNLKKKKYTKFIKKKKKRDFESKKYFVIGTKEGVLIIIDFKEPYKIVHLEKLCNDNIVSIFIFQNNVLILNCVGILFFMNAYNFIIYESIDIFEKYNKRDRSPLSNNNLLNSVVSSNILEKKLNSFKINKSNKNSSISNKALKYKSGNMYTNKENSIVYYEEGKKNYKNLHEDNMKQNYINGIENKYINSSCLLDIYILILGTSDNEIVMYDLINNEISFIYKKNYKINYFILENNHIIYNIENSLYKMNLTNYSSFKLLTLAKINISAFTFYSENVLICGTIKGNLYFFDISNNNVKVINKMERKNFTEKKWLHNNYSTKNEKEIIFSIQKFVHKKFVRKSNSIEKETCNDKIIGLVLSKSKNFLLCSLKNIIFLFKLNITGNEKIDLKCIRYLNINNILHINLLKNFDNLFYIATKENNNCYNYHLCSFNSAKIKKNKMDRIYFHILYENAWLCEFFYYNGESFILAENNSGKKNRCILLLDSCVFIIYSYTINRTNNSSSCNNLNCLIENKNYEEKNKNSDEKNNIICDEKNNIICDEKNNINYEDKNNINCEDKNDRLNAQRKPVFSNKSSNSNTLTNKKKFDLKENHNFNKNGNVTSEIHIYSKKKETKKIPNQEEYKKDLTNKLNEKKKEGEKRKKMEKEKVESKTKNREKQKQKQKEEESRNKKIKEIKEMREDKKKKIKGIKEKVNKENKEKKIKEIKEKVFKEYGSKKTKEIKEKGKEENEKKGTKKTYIYVNSRNQTKDKKLNIKKISSSILNKTKKKKNIQDSDTNVVMQKSIFKNDIKLKNRILLKDILKSYKEDKDLIGNQIGIYEKKKFSYIKYKLLKNILQKKNVEFLNYKKLMNENNYHKKEKSDEIKGCNNKGHGSNDSLLFLNEKNNEKINFYRLCDKNVKEVLIYDQCENNVPINKDVDQGGILKKNNECNYIIDYLRGYLSTNFLKECDLNENKNIAKNCVNKISLIKKRMGDSFIYNISNINNITSGNNNKNSNNNNNNNINNRISFSNKNNSSSNNNIIRNENKVFYLKNEFDKLKYEETANLIKRETNKINDSCNYNSERAKNYKSNNYENNIYDDNYIYRNYDNNITYIKKNYLYKNYLYFNKDNNENNKNNIFSSNYVQYNNTYDINSYKKNNFNDKKYQNSYYNANKFNNKKYTNKTCHIRYSNKISGENFIRNRISYNENTYLKGNNEKNSMFIICKERINKNKDIKDSYAGNMKYFNYNMMNLNVMNTKCNENTINTNHIINGRFSHLTYNSKNKSMNTSLINDSNKNFYKNE